MRFVELVYVLATEEAERIGVDHVARVSAGDSREGSMGKRGWNTVCELIVFVSLLVGVLFQRAAL